MWPQFDETDLALFEVHYGPGGDRADWVVQKLIEEIRIYQDLLQDSKFANRELESEIVHLRGAE